MARLLSVLSLLALVCRVAALKDATETCKEIEDKLSEASDVIFPSTSANPLNT